MEDICWCLVAMHPYGGACAVQVIDPKDKRPDHEFKRRYAGCEVRVVTREKSADLMREFLAVRDQINARLNAEYGAAA